MSFCGEGFGANENWRPNRNPLPEGQWVRMKYSAYKQRYADCRTVPGTYDANSKTVEVIVPEGRMKPNGVRGQRFDSYRFWYTSSDGGKPCEMYFRAVSAENAERQFKKVCRQEGLTPCNEPEDALFSSNRLRR